MGSGCTAAFFFQVLMSGNSLFAFARPCSGNTGIKVQRFSGSRFSGIIFGNNC